MSRPSSCTSKYATDSTGCKDGCHSDENSKGYILRSSFSKEFFSAYYGTDPLHLDDFLVCKTPYGVDLLRVISMKKANCCREEAVEVIRIATPEDIEKGQILKNKAQEAGVIFKDRLSSYPQLEMKLVVAHILLDQSKIIFFLLQKKESIFVNL